MLDAEWTAAEYWDIRDTVQPETDLLERMKEQLTTCEDDFHKGVPMLQNIDQHWLAADLERKQRIVGFDIS